MSKRLMKFQLRELKTSLHSPLIRSQIRSYIMIMKWVGLKQDIGAKESKVGGQGGKQM